MKRIVILGGGFAGIATAMRLERRLRPNEAEIALVSRENFSLFTPMVPEVSSGGLSARHVATPIRAQLRRTQFFLAEIRDIDLERRSVKIEHPLLELSQTLAFDHLVFALGSVTSTFGLPGVEERVLPLKTLEDADRLRNHVIAMLEMADVTEDPQARARLLTFVFVGGGFTGVEAAGEMVDFFQSITPFYRNVGPGDVRTILVEGGMKLLPDLQEGMGEYCARSLERRGVKVMFGDLVAGADDRGLLLRSGAHIPSATIVWSAGVKPSPLVSALGLATTRGGAIVANDDFSVSGHDGLWAIGDCAAVPNGKGGTHPPTAQHAIREGPVLADNIVARLRGTTTKPFRYESLGIMASLGARRGVAGIRGKYLLTGFPAFFLWRSYYLARLPGVDRRTRVAFDWTVNLIFPRDIAELRVYAQQIRGERAEIAAMPQ